MVKDIKPIPIIAVLTASLYMIAYVAYRCRYTEVTDSTLFISQSGAGLLREAFYPLLYIESRVRKMDVMQSGTYVPKYYIQNNPNNY